MFCSRAAEPIASNPQAENSDKGQDQPNADPEVKRPMTFGRFLLYAAGAVSGGTFLYYFYQTGFNLHKTEIAISRKLAELPFYWPPGPGEAAVNTTMPAVTVPQGLVDQLSAWFIYQDTALKDGVSRSDVLDLFGEMGLVDPEKESDTSFQSVGDEEFRKSVAKTVTSFIEKGRGRLNEYKRQSGVSLQETVQLLDDLINLHSPINPEITTTVAAKLDTTLAALVDAQQARMAVPGMALLGGQTGGESMPEVEADDKEILEMELAQLERVRSDLQTISKLSDAEKRRLADVESQIAEVRSLLSK